MKRIGILTVTLAVVALAAWFISTGGLVRSADADSGSGVWETALVERMDIGSTVLATGVIRPQVGAEVAVGKQFRVLGTTAFLTASPRYCRNQATSLASVGASLEFRLSRSWLVAASVDPLLSCESTAASTAATYQFGADVFWEKSY